MSTEKLIITREAVESGEYKADEGVIILIAPKGMPTVRYFRALASRVLGDRLLPQGKKRHPGDGMESVYKPGPLIQNTDDN